MKYYFTEEFDIREWERWEVEAESFGEAWRKYAQLREDGEQGEVVASDIIQGGDLIEVRDEKGQKYDTGRAEELAWPLE